MKTNFFLTSIKHFSIGKLIGLRREQVSEENMIPGKEFFAYHPSAHCKRSRQIVIFVLAIASLLLELLVCIHFDPLIPLQ